MKKTATILALLLAVALVSGIFMYANGTIVDIGDDRYDGPLGALLGVMFAGGGTLIAAFVMLVVGSVLAVVFAGVGVILLFALGLAALAVAAAISPLLLPLLVPVAIIWFLASRSKKQRLVREQTV